MTPICDLRGNVYLPEDPICITTGPLVGLGDHAVYSTLPKRFAELGYTVYVDKDISARSDETFEIFWSKNPYISGLTDKKPNAGYVRQGLFYEVANRFPLGSIEAMERAHGLPPPYSLAPQVYFEPKGFHLDLSQTVLFDFSSVSSHIGDQGVVEFINHMREKFRGAPFMQLLMPKGVSLSPPRIKSEQAIEVDSVYQYLDMLRCCRAWIGTEAGGQSLAAAIRGEHDVYDLDARPELVVLSTPKTFNSRGYTYRGVDYRVSQFCQDKDSDWWAPQEVTVHRYELQCAISLAQMRSLQPQPEPEKRGFPSPLTAVLDASHVHYASAEEAPA